MRAHLVTWGKGDRGTRFMPLEKKAVQECDSNAPSIMLRVLESSAGDGARPRAEMRRRCSSLDAAVFTMARSRCQRASPPSAATVLSVPRCRGEKEWGGHHGRRYLTHRRAAEGPKELCPRCRQRDRGSGQRLPQNRLWQRRGGQGRGGGACWGARQGPPPTLRAPQPG